MAVERGYNTIGLQNYGECWADKSPVYDKLGPAQNCQSMGTYMSNIVWVKTEKKVDYIYLGCFKDDETRLIPNFLGRVTSILECKNLAI